MSQNSDLQASWNNRRTRKTERLGRAAHLLKGKLAPTNSIVDVFQYLIEPGDKVALEGDNQKHADFLARSLVQVNPKIIHDLHMLISSMERSEHLDLFDRGIASLVDFSFAGPQSLRVSQMLADKKLKIGAIHTYNELYGRYYVDLIPNVALVCAMQADHQGNLYTGPNTEDTPAIVEAAAFSSGIIIVQVNEIVDKLPRVDIPADWVDVVVKADRPFAIEPLFTRDPRCIDEPTILIAMMALRGVYEKHGVTSLNHGIGFNTAAIELLLPTYGERLGLKGKICRNWVLNPHPNMIPAIESGWVESIYCFGSEVGMEDYVRNRSDIFFTGTDGSLRSNRVMGQLAGHYAADMFIGASLQIDAEGNSSTVTKGRLSGFGGAPNMGCDPHGRRHITSTWLDMKANDSYTGRGHKLVVQTLETFKKGGVPAFVDELDAISVGHDSNMEIAPIMIYGDDITHLVTEEGVAYLYKAQTLEERKLLVAAIAGATEIGKRVTGAQIRDFRKQGKVANAQDLGVRPSEARHDLLAARNMDDLVTWSGGLYNPPPKFRSW